MTTRTHRDIDKISYEVYRPNKTTILKFNVYLAQSHWKTNERESYHKEYRYTNRAKYADQNRMTSMKLKPYGFLTLEDKDADWSSDDSTIMIGIRHIMRLERGLEKAVSWFYDDVQDKNGNTIDLFGYIDDELHLNPKAKGLNLKIRHFPQNRIIGIRPTVIDREDVEYEGVEIFMNNKTSRHLFSIDELESLLYVIRKFDIFQSTQLTLNYLQRPEFGEEEIDIEKQRKKDQANAISGTGINRWKEAQKQKKKPPKDILSDL